MIMQCVQFANAASDLHLCKAPGSRSESQVCWKGIKTEVWIFVAVSTGTL